MMDWRLPFRDGMEMVVAMMNHVVRSCWRLSLVLAFSLGSFVPVQAADEYFVNWSGSFLSHTGSGQRIELGPEDGIKDKEGKEIGAAFPYSEDKPKSPSSDKYDSSKPSALFYGAFEVFNPSIPASELALKVRPLNQIQGLNGENAFSIGSAPPGNAAETFMKGLIFWKKSDFLAGWSEKKMSWKDIQGLSMNANRFNGKMGGNVIRFAVQSGGKWYLSESDYRKPGNFVINDSKWTEWVPSIPFPPVPESFSVQDKVLEDITAVGIYFEIGSSVANLSAVLGFNSFRASAIAAAR